METCKCLFLGDTTTLIHPRLLPWWSGSYSLSPFYLQFNRPIETWKGFRLVSSSKITLCYFPDEEIEEESLLFLPRTCLRQTLLNTTCSPLDLFFCLWEPFQAEAALYFTVNIWVRPTHWEFPVGKMKAKMPPVEVHWLSLPPTHRLMQLQQFQGVNRPWGTTSRCQSCTPLRGPCQQRFLIHHIHSGNS